MDGAGKGKRRGGKVEKTSWGVNPGRSRARDRSAESIAPRASHPLAEAITFSASSSVRPGSWIRASPAAIAPAAPAPPLSSRELKSGSRPRVFVSAWLRSQRSEEHTSELQSLMRISYAVFCLKQQNHTQQSK